MNFSFPTLLSCLFRLFFAVKAFLYQIPALYLVIRPVLKASQLQWSVLGPLLPVQRVSTKRDRRVSPGKRKCYSTMSVGDCTSVGVLHVLFLQSLSQVSTCQTVLQQLVKHLMWDPWKVIKILTMSLTIKLRYVGWRTPKLILKLHQTWTVHTLSYCFLALFLSEDAIKIQKVNMLRSHQFNNISSCWKQK